MSIPGVCPSCGAKHALPVFLQDARARRALLAALKASPKLADPIVTYLELFSTGDRAIRQDRLANLLEELVDAITSSQVTRQGRTWPAPLNYWQQALEQMQNKRGSLRLPLKNHNYLFEIIAGMADSAEGRREARREHDRTHSPQGKRQGMQSASDLVTGKKKPPEGWKKNMFKSGENNDG